MTSSSYNRFLVMLVIVAGLLAGITYGLTLLPLLSPFALFAWLSLGFFTLLTAGVYAMYDKGALARSNAVFMSLVFGAFGIKLFISVIFLLVYFFVAGRPALWFVLPFFVHYFGFTILETVFVVRKLQQNKKIWEQPEEK